MTGKDLVEVLGSVAFMLSGIVILAVGACRALTDRDVQTDPCLLVVVGLSCLILSKLMIHDE